MNKTKARIAACAHQAVANAIKKGNLLPVRGRRCVDCGKKAQEYDHYKGYEKVNRIVVEPVCRSCHVRRGFLRGEHLSKNYARRKSKNGRWKGGWKYRHSKEYLKRRRLYHKLYARRWRANAN